MEQVIKPQTLGGFVRSLSGLFMTKNNPHGLSPKECAMIAALLARLKEDEEVTRDIKIAVANELNQTIQITTNYLNIFKKKGVLKDNKLHPIFYKKQVLIERNGESVV